MNMGFHETRPNPAGACIYCRTPTDRKAHVYCADFYECVDCEMSIAAERIARQVPLPAAVEGLLRLSTLREPTKEQLDMFMRYYREARKAQETMPPPDAHQLAAAEACFARTTRKSRDAYWRLAGDHTEAGRKAFEDATIEFMLAQRQVEKLMRGRPYGARG